MPKKYSAPGTFFKWLDKKQPKIILNKNQTEIATIINKMPVAAGKTFIISLLKEWDNAGEN